MPIETFHHLWHTPGFKYEYGHGKANISVQRSASPTVVASPSMVEGAVPDDSSTLPEDVRLETAENAEIENLRALWPDVFVRTPDYYGYSVGDIQKEASKILDTLYRGESPSLHPASVIARWNERLVGMLLVSDARTRPLIEGLGVRLDLQRRGVGVAMAREMAKGLKDRNDDVICSGYLLANAESAGWHKATGFVEIPDWLTALHRFRCAEHNMRQGLVRDTFGTERYVETLRAEVEQMSQDREEDPAAHSPRRWIKSDGDRIDQYLHDRLSQRDSSGWRRMP